MLLNSRYIWLATLLLVCYFTLTLWVNYFRIWLYSNGIQLNQQLRIVWLLIFLWNDKRSIYGNAWLCFNLTRGIKVHKQSQWMLNWTWEQKYKQYFHASLFPVSYSNPNHTSFPMNSENTSVTCKLSIIWQLFPADEISCSWNYRAVTFWGKRKLKMAKNYRPRATANIWRVSLKKNSLATVILKSSTCKLHHP